MNPNAICPLLSAPDNEVSCKREGCAWYDEFRCVIFSVNSHLNDIVNNTSYIYTQDSSAQVESILNSVEQIKDSLGK